jgi:hypothetical protein
VRQAAGVFFKKGKFQHFVVGQTSFCSVEIDSAWLSHSLHSFLNDRLFS